MKIIAILGVALVIILALGLLSLVFLFGIANLLPEAIEAIDETREWLKERREEAKDDKG